MIGAFVLMLNAACAAWTVSVENWWVLPINIAGMLMGLALMLREA